MTNQGPKSNYYIDRYRVQTPVKELGNSDEAAVDFDSEYSNEPTSSYLEESNPNEELSSLQKGNPSGAQGQDQTLEDIEEVMNMAGEIEDADDPLMGESAPESDSSVQTRQDSEKFLKDLEKDLRNDKYLSSEQRDQAKKQIAELRKALKEDPEYPVEEELSDLIETLAADKKKVEAMEVEAGRATAQKEAIIHQVNGELSTNADYFDGGHAFVPGAPWREEGAPETGLINGNREAQALDLAMQGKTGLENSQVPGKVVEILYNTQLSAEEQSKALKSAVAGLPKASQTYVLARVVNEIQKQDTAKIDFLSEYAPEVLSFLKEEINYGKGQIEEGSLAQDGTRLSGAGYERYDTDTHWYVNDWDAINLPFSELTQGMADAVHILDQANSSASLSTSESEEE